MGYANRLIRIDFPDLSEADDLIYVTIRNPKTLPVDKLQPTTLDVDPTTGQPVDQKAALAATYEVIAGIVQAWNVYDANDDAATVPLGLPATPALVACLPMEIINEIGSRIGQAVTPPQ